MAKKQLADLIKEEVGKSTDGNDNGVNAASESSPSETTSSVTAPSNDTANAVGATKQKRSPTKADLEATVATLTLQLEKAQTTETNHQKQIAAMQNDFSQQLDILKAELAEAKTTVLQLVDNNANTKTLQEQVQSLQTELAQEKEKVTTLQQDLQQVHTLKAELDQAQKRIAQLSKTPSTTANPTFSRPAAKPLRPASRSAPLSLQKSAPTANLATPDPTRPEKFLSTESKFTRLRKGSMDRQQPANKLSDNEIGWFD